MYQDQADFECLLAQQQGGVVQAVCVALVDHSDEGPFASAWRRLEGKAIWPTQTLAFLSALKPLLANEDARWFYLRRGNDISAALLLSRKRGFFSRWEQAGERDLFEPCDVLWDRKEDLAPLAVMLRGLNAPLMLNRLVADSPLIPSLREEIKGRGWLSVRPAMPCPYISLDEKWREPENCFNTRRKSDFRRAARRAESFGEVTYQTVTPDAGTFDTLFDEAVEVELQGWKKAAGTAVGSDERQESFFRRFLHSACENGLCRISFMRIDGKAVAMHMAVTWSGGYWLFKIGHDAAYDKASPGTLLMLHTLKWAADNGLNSYEFLGGVEEWITRFWTQNQHDCVCVRSYPYSIRGAVAFTADAFYWLKCRLARFWEKP